MNQEKTSSKPTLSEFIDQNHRLLSTLAFFAALTAFAKQLDYVGGFVSFIFLSCTVLVWLEILPRFPSASGTSRLTWFENLLTIGVVGLAVYWVLTWLLFYRTTHQLYNGLFVLVMVPVLWAARWVAERVGLFTRARAKATAGHRWVPWETYLLVLGPPFLVAALITNLLVGPVGNLIDQVHPTPTARASPTAKQSLGTSPTGSPRSSLSTSPSVRSSSSPHP
jgi:hypothetical protein